VEDVPLNADQAPDDDAELERDKEKLVTSHANLREATAATVKFAADRRADMQRMKTRWAWDNKMVAALLGIKPGAVWKAVKDLEDGGSEADRALAS
jgi:hypothetical protein